MRNATRQLGAVVVACLTLLTGLPAAAAIFTVDRIPVDVTAEDAVTAREQAIVQGQRDGLARLLQRLTAAEDWARLPSVTDLPLDAYVRSFEIGSEEVSATQYIAELTVEYDADAVTSLLSLSDVPYTERRTPPLVVLPLAINNGVPDLWSENEPWYQAWAETLDPESLVHLVLPLGDLEDVLAISAEQASAEDPAALEGLAARYAAGGVLIARARVPSDDSAADLEVPYEAHDNRPDSTLAVRGVVRAVPPAELADVLSEAVRNIQGRLDEQWKGPNLLRFDQSTTILVEVALSNLPEWVRLNAALGGMPEVKDADVETFARRMVRIRLEYLGDLPQFQAALAGLGLELVQEGETWRLQRAAIQREGAPESATPAPSI